MARTDQASVEGVLLNNFAADTDLTPFIDMASAVVDRVITCATAKAVSISTTQRELMERWLAAHYYTQSDPTYKSRSTADASGAFNVDGKEYLNAAIGLDPSGCLNAILNRKTAGAVWLGKRPSEQIDFYARD